MPPSSALWIRSTSGKTYERRRLAGNGASGCRTTSRNPGGRPGQPPAASGERHESPAIRAAGFGRRMPHRARCHVQPLRLLPVARALAVRGETLVAFDGRCIPGGGVAPPSNTAGILSRRAWPAGRLARLGATPDFHHGLLGSALASSAVSAGNPAEYELDVTALELPSNRRGVEEDTGPTRSPELEVQGSDSVAHGITGRMVCFFVSSVPHSSLARRT
jgi:hypothetical protein